MKRRFIYMFVCIFIFFNIETITSTADENIMSESNIQSISISDYSILESLEKILHSFIFLNKTPNEDMKMLEMQEDKSIEYAGVVYLTFDDGPVSTITPQILDILKKYDVKATFFNIGEYVEKNPQIVKRVYDEGHTVGNHTYTHKKAMFSSFDVFKQEIDKTSIAIKNVTGEYPKYFRVPYGIKLNKAYKQYLDSNGFTIVSWNCESYDSRKNIKTTEAILDGIKSTMKGRKEVTVIMHDTYGKQHTVDALPSVIEYFKSINYQFKRYGE